MRNQLSGWITVGGLCERAPCEGHLELKYFSEHKIRYLFRFGADGHQYAYVGEKVNIMPWNLPTSHTTCFGRITAADTGKLISTSVVFFELRTIVSFTRSFRLLSASQREGAGDTT
jgi:hypothetical protein